MERETETVTVAVCDDEPIDLQRIRQVLLDLEKELCLDFNLDISSFSSGKGLYEKNRETPFDLLFLDLEMPEWDGMELAKRLTMDNPRINLVFVSSHESWVFDTYEYAPLWFVRKSVLERDVRKALIKYSKLTSKRMVNYRIKHGFSYRELLVKDILYVECSGHKLVFRTIQGNEYRAYGSLKSVGEELENHDFIRVHRSFLVNQRYVVEVGKLDVILSGEIAVPIGKDRRKEVREAMIHYDRKQH